ncbi:MAG: MerR family transcriptional regulator [Gemmatimonadetes bacterium]|nr:MerR family transcriptional regulator [Gemmatimonadota bacterium]NNM05165.1 MerR family transcriptional regulator [Gemmatimonadota bacterium]
MKESIAKKAYYSIGDVCDLTGLKPHVLRYWETQFDILRPTKNRAGNRVFRPKDIELVMLVKNLLYEQKYTIEGANQKLLDMRREGELAGGQQEVLEPEFLTSMKGELEQLAKILTPSEPLAAFTAKTVPDAPEGEGAASAEADEELQATPDQPEQLDLAGPPETGQKPG